MVALPLTEPRADPGESIAYFNNEVASGEDVNVKMSNVIRVKGSTLYPTVKGKEAKEKDGKFYFTIEGQVESLETVKLYKLYATSAEERKKWVDGLLALGMTRRRLGHPTGIEPS